MGFLTDIVYFFNDAADFFYDLYQETYDWIKPFKYVSNLFLFICYVFEDLAWAFRDFGDLIWDWKYEIEGILSWSTIRSYIRNWLPDLEDAIEWWWDWWDWVTDTVDEWWYSTKNTVQAWIDVAVEGLDTLKVAWSDFWNITFPQWTSKLTTLRAEWDNFWTLTLPGLVSQIDLGVWWQSRLLDIDLLMDTKIKDWFPFYDSLSQLWDSVVEFMGGPLDWLEKKFTDWFLGAE